MPPLASRPLPEPAAPPAAASGLSSDDKLVYGLVISAILFFAGLEIPYYKPHIPAPVMLAIGLVSTLGLFFLAFERYALVIVLLVAYMPFSSLLPGDFGGLMLAFNLTNILMVVVIIGWVARGSFRGERLYHPTSLDIPLFLYCVWTSFSLIRGMNTAGFNYYMIIELKRYLSPLLVFYVFANNLQTRKEVLYVLFTVTFVTAIVSVMTLKEFYFDLGGGDRRVRGICSQPNELASYFAYYAPYSLILFATGLHRLRGWWYLPVYVLSGWAMTRTLSRGGILAFAAGSYAAFWVQSRRLTLVLLAVGYIWVFWYPDTLPGAIGGRFRGTWKSTDSIAELANPENVADASAAGRMTVWGLCWPLILQNPVFGVGHSHIKDYTQMDPHNQFIQVAVECGLPAAALFVWLLFRTGASALFIARRADDPTLAWLGKGHFASVIAVCASCMFGGRLHSQELSSLFWILAAMVMMSEKRMLSGDPEFPMKQPELPPQPPFARRPSAPGSAS